MHIYDTVQGGLCVCVPGVWVSGIIWTLRGQLETPALLLRVQPCPCPQTISVHAFSKPFVWGIKTWILVKLICILIISLFTSHFMFPIVHWVIQQICIVTNSCETHYPGRVWDLQFNTPSGGPFSAALLYRVVFIVCLVVLAPIPASCCYWNFACVRLLIDIKMVSQLRFDRNHVPIKHHIPSASQHSWPVFPVPSHSLQALFPGCSVPTGVLSVVVPPFLG